MGLRKLFSSSNNNKEEKDLKTYDTRRNSSRSSTLSLTQSISNWTHKEKEKIKHHSLNTNNRYSQPSPAISTASLPPTRNSVKVTQNEKQQQQQQQRHTTNSNNNPFAVTTPVTPSESMRDVNDVVNVLRNSLSSEISTSSSSVAEEHVSDTIPVAIKEEEEEPMESTTNPFQQTIITNPFVKPVHHDNRSSKEELTVSDKRQSQVFYPPPNNFNNDSNKYEVDSEETTIATPDDSDATNKEKENETLYSELLAVSLQLDTINPNNATEIKNRLKGVNELLTKALDNSSHLQSKISSIIEHSKQTILTTTDENKALKENEENLKLEMKQLQATHTLALTELKVQQDNIMSEYQGLKELHEGLSQENQTLKEQFETISTEHQQLKEQFQGLLEQYEKLKGEYQITQKQLNQYVTARSSVFQLFQQDEEEEMDDNKLQDKLKAVIALSATSQLLESKLKSKEIEMNALENDKQEIEQKYQQLNMKSENDERQHQSEMKESEDKYAELLIEKNESLANQKAMDARMEALVAQHAGEKLKLESCTTQIRDLMDDKTKEHNEEHDRLLAQIDILKNNSTDDVTKIAEENISLKEQLNNINKDASVLASDMLVLKKTLESTKEENIGLQVKIKETQEQLVELQTSKDTMDKVLKERIHMINEQSAQTTEESKKALEEAWIENKRLKQELIDMETVSKEAAKAVMDENERLEHCIRQMEESSNMAIHENVALNEEVELLSKNTARRSLVTENQHLKNELKTMNNIRQENINLSELVECLQDKVKELSIQGENKPLIRKKTTSKKEQQEQRQQQEELMRMHTRAQLGLIEYLEGEDDVIQAMARFKKQLETEMREFDSTNMNHISSIPSVSTSQRMR